MFNAAFRGSYITQAAQNDALENLLKVTTAYSPNPGEMAQIALKAESDRRNTDKMYEAQVDALNTTGDSKLSSMKKMEAAQQYKQGQQRMAGILGAVGAAAYGGARIMKKPKITPPEKRQSADDSGVISALENQVSTLQEQFKKTQEIYNQDIPSTAELLEQAKGGTKPTAAATVGSGTATATKPTSGISLSPLTGKDKEFADIIGKYESGDLGYDAVNQGGEKGGTSIPAGFYSGAFSKMKQHGGRKLTDLTLTEIFDLQSDPGKGAMSNDEWVKSGKLHAVGRYQFIGSTLKDEVTKMGLDLNTKFTPEIQDKIMLSHARRVGSFSPWVGPSTKASSQERAILNSWFK